MCVCREQQWELLTWGIQAVWSSLNPAAPSPREAEEDRIPTGAPTHMPEAGMGCWEMPQSQVSKGHSPAAAAASALPVPPKAAQWSLKDFSKGKSSPAKSGVLHLDSGADQAISPVLTEEGELRQGCGNKSCCSGHCPDEVMSFFQGLGGLAAEKLVEMGAVQVWRQFYFFSSKTVSEVGACSF